MNDFQLTNPENPDKCDPALSQWYTPPELAERIVRWAYHPDAHEIDNLDTDFCVLEPSCGRGAIIHALTGYRVGIVGVDIDKANVEHCREEFPGAFIHGDFLKFSKVDLAIRLAIMNPPFEGGATEAHVLHALKFADRVVCHCPLTTLAGQDRREGLWSVAYLKRLVIHASRPKYSGNKNGGMTDMCTIDVVRRPELHPVEVSASGVSVEWWA